MLLYRRKRGESIVLRPDGGDPIIIKLCSVGTVAVCIGVDCVRSCEVNRIEVDRVKHPADYQGAVNS